MPRLFRAQPRGKASLGITHPRAKGLVGYWPLNEGMGTKALDLSGGGRHGTLLTSTSHAAWVPGRKGWGLEFTGADADAQHVNCGTNPNENSTIFSISVWVKLGTNTDYGGIVSNAITTGNRSGYFIVYGYHGADTFGFYVYTGVSPSAYISVHSPVITDALYHHLVLTYDGARIRGFVDGVQLAEDGDALGDTIAMNSSDLVIAHWLTNYAAQYYFGGVVSDVAIYERVLAPEEVYLDYVDFYEKFQRLGQEELH